MTNASISHALAIGALLATGLATGNDPMPSERVIAASEQEVAETTVARADRGFVRAVSLITGQQVLDARQAMRRAQRSDAPHRGAPPHVPATTPETP